MREGPCWNKLVSCTDANDKLSLQEIIDAGVRERFFGGYNQLSGLDSLPALGTETLVWVSVGNLRPVDRLVKLSGAALQLSATVKKHSQLLQGGWYLGCLRGGTDRSDIFDTVIIAAPLGLSNITFEPALSPQPGLDLSCVDSFVTHFTTPNRLNASFSKVENPSPQNILTTGVIGKASSPFVSLTLIGVVMSAQTSRNENL